MKAVPPVVTPGTPLFDDEQLLRGRVYGHDHDDPGFGAGRLPPRVIDYQLQGVRLPGCLPGGPCGVISLRSVIARGGGGGLWQEGLSRGEMEPGRYSRAFRSPSRRRSSWLPRRPIALHCPRLRCT
ncbi:hypothetical protein GCM10010393_41740 [Streptomyces gobitricini]|uniref:Uncharacterized protein n=1 Tax=Streptomyces gobitricini TaxID=68211 RepID=A0ABN3MN71_9ACTN